MQRSPSMRGWQVAVVVWAIVSSAQPAAAQSNASSASRESVVRGVVQDPPGARIANATIVVRLESAGLEHLVDGAPDGTFVTPRLVEGRYVITASATGFAPAAQIVAVPAAESLTLTLTPAPIIEHVTVVSASRQEQLRESLNTRVDVIPRSRIEETGGHETVGEILRELPGVVTRRGSETAGAAGEQIQGIDSRQVLVLIDGQPMVGARGIKRGGVLNLDRQSSARLERIEVVKGAASALYGSEALGGVINLITREPASPFETTVALSVGNFGVVGSRVDGGFKQQSTYGIFTVERHQHDGFDLTPTTFDMTGAPYRRYDVLAKLQRQLTPTFSLGGFITGYHNETGGRSNGELGPQEDDITDRALAANLSGRWLVGGGTALEMRGYVSAYSERSTGRLAPPRSTPLAPGLLEERFGKLDVAVARTIGSRQMLQAGGEWAHDRYEGTNRVRDELGGHAADTTVAWAQHRWSATNRLTTTAGARIDRRAPFETAVSPKLAASVRLHERLHARASYGRGFRAPDLGQLYYRFLSPSNFYQVIGNPDLDPEYAHSWQLGGEFIAPRRRARLGVNVFRNDVRDLIESVTVGIAATPQQLADLLARERLDVSFRPALGRPILTYRNVVDVVTQGIELDTEAAVTNGISVGGAYTYLSAHDRDTAVPLTGRHRHHGHVRLSWQPRQSRLRASLRGTFFSSWIAARASSLSGIQDTLAPAYALWDAFLSHRITRGLSTFLTLDNLTHSRDPNTGVFTPSGAPAPIYRPDAGRTARVGLQWSFSTR